jgi:hypothetical protein
VQAVSSIGHNPPGWHFVVSVLTLYDSSVSEDLRGGVCSERLSKLTLKDFEVAETVVVAAAGAGAGIVVGAMGWKGPT